MGFGWFSVFDGTDYRIGQFDFEHLVFVCVQCFSNLEMCQFCFFLLLSEQ